MLIDIRRRELIAALGGAAAWPLATPAQQPTMPVIGVLYPGSVGDSLDVWEAFGRGLAEAGYVEGRNVRIEYRVADGHYDRLPELATALVHRKVAVIAACGSSAPGLAAKDATATIPIVFQTGGDPVADGLVASMNRPGRSDWRQPHECRHRLLHEALPKTSVIGCLINPAKPGAESQLRQLQASARALGIQLEIAEISSERELADAFATIVKAGAGALFVASDPAYTHFQGQIALFAVRHGLPTMFATRAPVATAGLMSYDSSITDSFRQVGAYVGRILKGDQPGDLPVLQPTKFELVINLKVAKVLGLAIAEAFLLRADEVIE
jgi:putative ABC transport system substrate-binding protein